MDEHALIIGRFQPLHDGHQQGLIEPALEEYDSVTLGIGVSGDEPSCHDPLTYQERDAMIEQVYEDVETVPIDDQGEDEQWHDHVLETATKALETDTFTVITGNDWVISCLEDETAPYEIDVLDEDDMYDRETYSGTAVREDAAHGEDWTRYLDDAVVSYLTEIGFEDRLQLQDCYTEPRIEA